MANDKVQVLASELPESDRRPAGIWTYVKIARFDHWVKNVFVLPGAALALLLKPETSSFRVSDLLLALVATGLVASANYVINEFLDAESDRYHPIKSSRPGARRELKSSLVALEYVVLSSLGLGIGCLLNLSFVIVLVILLLMGLVYNVRPLRLKDIAYLDVLSESFNNPLRLLLGWYAFDAIALPPSSVMLSYWMGGAYLMAIKRYAEYREIADPGRAALYRKSFEHYTEQSLLLSAFFYALNSVLLLGVFLIKYRVEYLLAFPLIAALFSL
jgi:decaprenyl-phosphate phosphoribosyltransferase